MNNMDETKLYSWFLGPKAENADMLEGLVLEALRDCVFWRRNFHPEDDIIITEKCKREDAFQDSQALVRSERSTMGRHSTHGRTGETIVSKGRRAWSPPQFSRATRITLSPGCSVSMSGGLICTPICRAACGASIRSRGRCTSGSAARFGFRCGYAKQPAGPAPRRGVNEVIEGV
jgi:hypothetical protein